MQHLEGNPQELIGRTRELALFSEWLRRAHELDAPWIVYFYDALEAEAKKGGVGKTLLLHHCAMLARTIYPDIVIVRIDFFNIADRDGVVIADRVVDALRAQFPLWDTTRFAQSLAHYKHTLQANEDTSEVRKQLSDTLVKDLQVLDETLQEQRKYVLLFLDTYELIEQNPSSSVLREAHSFPDNYQFSHLGVVMAGRNALDWTQLNWKGRDHEVQSVPLSPFTEEEMVEYLRSLLNVEIDFTPEQLAHLYDQTQDGRPILVGLVKDVLNQRTITAHELINIPKERFEERLVGQINQLDSPFDLIVKIMAHAYHRFNFDMLTWIMDQEQFQDALEDTQAAEVSARLSEFSFVRRATSGDDFVLHDEMRPLINRYCWQEQDRDKRYRSIISQAMIAYYKHKLPEVKLEQLRQAYNVEMLFHEFFVDPAQAYDRFRKSFISAMSQGIHSFARSLLQEAQQYREQLTAEQRYVLKFEEMRLLQREENALRALEIYDELARDADPVWFASYKARLLSERGRCFMQLSKFSAAIDCFNEAREIEQEVKRQASILSWLGYAHRRMGQLDTALVYYERVMEMYKELGSDMALADAFNSIGVVYRLQGKTEEALRRSKIGLRTRRNLFSQGRLSEMYIGLSLNSLGAIYLQIDDLIKAEQSFLEALDIFRRTGYKKGSAMSHNRLGQIYLAKDDQDTASLYFERAYTTSLGIDAEAQITSLVYMGRVAILEEKWDLALQRLKQAVLLAEEIDDDYQQAEAHIELANALQRYHNQSEAEHNFREAEKICEQYSYNYLRGLAREYQGIYAHEQGEYQLASQFFGPACKYMVEHNYLQYAKTLRRVTDFLLDVPGQHIQPILKALEDYWVEQGLAAQHPELIDVCEEVKVLVK